MGKQLQVFTDHDYFLFFCLAATKIRFNRVVLITGQTVGTFCLTIYLHFIKWRADVETLGFLKKSEFLIAVTIKQQRFFYNLPRLHVEGVDFACCYLLIRLISLGPAFE